MRVLFAVLLIGMLASVTWAISQRQEQESNGDEDVYSRRWAEFLNKMPVGTKLDDAKESLSSVTELQGFMPYGGTGAGAWVFRVDDVNEIVINTELTRGGDVISREPVLSPRRKWLQFPDGTIVSADLFDK